MASVWHPADVLGGKDAQTRGLREADLRVMARMRHTGVSSADIGWIFGIPPAEARRLVRLYVRMRLDGTVF